MMDELNNGALSLPELPCDCIINNILTRVPSKSLARFRCVCKQWNNLFFFINFHRNQQNVGSFVWCEKHTDHNGTKHSLVCFDISKKEEWMIPFQLPEYVDINDIFVHIESHGEYLLLITKQNDVLQYNLYNPVTKGSMPLLARYPGGRICLGYDSTTSKYKLVDPEIHAHNDLSWCFIFDNHLKKWKTVYLPSGVKIVSNPQEYQFEPVFSYPALHWLCFDVSKQGGILSFDVRTEIFSIINFPCEVVHIWSSNLLEMGGLLWLVHPLKSPSNYRWKLWYLKRNGGGDQRWVEKGIIDLSGAERLLKDAILPEPFLILTDPTFKVFIKFVKHDHTKKYVYSYDMDLKQWEFVYKNNAFISYWNANGSVLEKKSFALNDVGR